MEAQQKINQIEDIPGVETCNRYSPSINSHAAIANNFSPVDAMNPCHTVTHVTHISLIHCPKEGLDFILSHLQEPMWPRTISTKTTDGRQVIVNSHGEALAYFKAANYFDCRISAYPYWRPSALSDFVGIKNTIPPDLIMIDLDLSNFNEEATVIRATLRKTLLRINQLLSLIPTVICSGNGYHIYVPISATVLEDIKEFTNIEQVSTRFLRFAEWYLSYKGFYRLLPKAEKMDTIEEFFRDVPWKSLPPHEIYQSPCYPIIGIRTRTWNNIETGIKKTVRWYYCKLHPKVENIHLDTIEHHCKYSEPEKHKSKVLEFLQLLLQQCRSTK